MHLESVKKSSSIHLDPFKHRLEPFMKIDLLVSLHIQNAPCTVLQRNVAGEGKGPPWIVFIVLTDRKKKLGLSNWPFHIKLL